MKFLKYDFTKYRKNTKKRISHFVPMWYIIGGMKYFKKVLKSLGITVLFFILAKAKIFGEISPFVYSFYFAIMLVLNKKLPFSIFMAIGVGLSNISIWSILVLMLVLSINILLKILRKHIKAKFVFSLYFLGLIISEFPTIFLYSTSNLETLFYSVNLLLSVVSFYLFYRLLLAFKTRGIKTRFVLDEKFAMFTLILAVFLGINNVDILNLGLDRVLLSHFLMFLTKLENPMFAIWLTLGVGCSKLVLKKSAGYLLNYLLWCIGLAGLKNYKNITRAIFLICLDLLIGVTLEVCGVYSLSDLLSIIFGVLIYVLYPKKLKLKIENTFQYSLADGIELDNFSKGELGLRLASLSKLFNSINGIYKEMVIPSEKIEENLGALSDEVSQNICSRCVNYKVCYRTNNIQKDLQELINMAIVKNGITNFNLTKEFNLCISRSALVNQINAEAQKFKALKKTVAEQNLTKVTIGNQFKSVSEALEVFENNMLEEFRAERIKEEDLINYLMFEGIECKDCRIINSKSGGVKKVLLMLKLGVDKDKFLKALSRYFGQNMEIINNKFASVGGWQVVEVGLAPKYSFLYAVETESLVKNTKNGDGHSISKVFGGNYLISIADGKGHGQGAYKTSKKTLELIENYFRAGIDNGTIIKSVNQILSFNNSENFSALDIVIFNPFEGEANFIKLGSTPTIIKRSGVTKAIVSNALPIGVCEFVNATIENVRLISGDVVVLTSDGVFDAFRDLNNFTGYINNLQVSNVNIFAKCLLDEAIRRSGGKTLDDLTVVVFKVF